MPTSVSTPPCRPTLGAMLRHLAAVHGEDTLVVLGDQRATYGEIERQSAALARALLAAGVGKGTRVALLAPNGPQWLIGCFAITRVGAMAVLCNTYHKARELGWVLHHADVGHLLSVDRHLEHDYVDRLAQALPGLVTQRAAQLRLAGHPYLRTISMWGDRSPGWSGSIDDLMADQVSEELLEAAENEVSPADPAVVVYSSGSTADPKGVVHGHGALVRHSHNLASLRDTRRGDVLYTPMPLFWVGGLVWTLLCAMHAGATVLFEDRFEPGATLALLEREKATHIVGWPHMGKALAEHPDFARRDLSSVRASTIPELQRDAERAIDPLLRPNSLGMTETCGPHSMEPAGVLLPDGKQGSFGRSVPGVEHRIVDPLDGRVLGPGEFGEIQVRGYSLLLGMLKRERDEVFTADGWYATGDGGQLDADGHLFFKGRLGEVIKTSGFNVTPREVELVIEEQPEVMHAFVMGVSGGERGEKVTAAVVSRPGHVVEPGALRARLRDQLSSYKVPVEVLTLASPTDLPWLDSGKVDRRALQRTLEERFGSSSAQ